MNNYNILSLNNCQLTRSHKICLLLDEDECTLNTDGCDHNCINTPGSFVCTCNSGFFLALDQKTCQGKALPVRETLLHQCVMHFQFIVRK